MTEYFCCQQAFTPEAFIAHIKGAHGFTDGTKCSRRMTAALDGADFYRNEFEVEIPCGGTVLKVQMVNSGKRRGR